MKTFEFDTLGTDQAAKCGLIVLQSDVTIEDEFRYYFSGVPISLLVNRIPFENEVTVDTLKKMESQIKQSMSLFPVDAHFDCVGYGCTSGALHIGHDAIMNLVKEVRPTNAVTNPMRAVKHALEALQAKNIAYLAPYSKLVSQSMVDELGTLGFNVVAAATFDEMQDRVVGQISPQSIKEACYQLVAEHSVDAIFVSCTNMKCAQIIGEVEAHTGVAMVSSNQALAWHMASQLELTHTIDNKGRLFEC